MAQDITWIGYTTQYREGSEKFARVAETMAAALRRDGHPVEVHALFDKLDFLSTLTAVGRRGDRISSAHFIGHGGMYGPMFGTTSWPEQMSRFEWETLRDGRAPRREGDEVVHDGALVFADGASFHIHTCRSARWFAPYLARTLGITVYGNFWYTAFSSRPDRVALVDQVLDGDARAPLYLFGVPGRKSHGLLGSAAKYAGLHRAEDMRRFDPAGVDADGSYDAVADRYAEAFKDIRVRRAEWAFLSARVPDGARVLDIGCGPGALLGALAPRIAEGVGVDVSERLLAHATRSFEAHPRLRAHLLDGPRLPVPDASMDVVISMLSFRYLDWDPMVKEIERVLRPGGTLLVVDMAASAPAGLDYLRAARDRLQDTVARRTNPRFHRALTSLVSDEGWARMLQYNPTRAEHEYRWYLKSRFPSGRFQTLRVSMSAKVLAFEARREAQDAGRVG